MGIVFRAYDSVTRRHVALKTLRGAVERADLELFEQEWTVLARISHPNIVDILDTGEFEEDGESKPFFVMPLLPGNTLDKLIAERSTRLTVERTVEILVQACRGLQAAHDQGLVHRDMKPSNIFVMDDDAVKIIDFGVVHLVDTRSFTGIKGTLDYMAPEQLQLRAATAQSDIFSLGVVAYEALTGQRPFAGFSGDELITAIRTHLPPPACELNVQISQLLSQTVQKAMAKAPFHRYDSAREFAETLQKAVRNERIECFDGSRVQPRIERTRKALQDGDLEFAQEILTELESEGHQHAEMPGVRAAIDQTVRFKKVRELLDSARSRFAEEEYPLALQKVQEVLELDPTNSDGIAIKSKIERHRSEKQLGTWFELIRKELENSNFSGARRGVDEVFRLSPSNSRGRDALREIERREQEASAQRELIQSLDPLPSNVIAEASRWEERKDELHSPGLTRRFEQGADASGGGVAVLTANPESAPAADQTPILPSAPPPRQRFLGWAAAMAGLLVLVITAVGILSRLPPKAPPVPAKIVIEMRPNPADAHLLLNGKPIEKFVAVEPGQYRVKATREGYRSLTRDIAISDHASSTMVVPIVLQVLPVELRVDSDLKSGKVLVDDQPNDLVDGDFIKGDIKPGQHTVSVTDGKMNMVAFTFTAEAGKAAMIETLDSKSSPALIVSTLSNRATAWATAGLKVGRAADSLQEIPSTGMALSALTEGQNDFFVEDGKTTQKTTLETATAPRISVMLGSARQVGTLVIHSDIPQATVVVNGLALKRHMTNGRLMLGLPPNSYRVRLQQEGYQNSDEQSIDLKTGDTKTLQFEMAEVTKKGIFSFEKFPPETDITIDGNRVGTTGADGILRTTVTAGAHTLSFRKQGYDGSTVSRDVQGDALTVVSGEGLLQALGTVMLKTNPSTAKVTYRRVGEAQIHEAASGQSLALKEGTYEFTARAEKYESNMQSVTVALGKQITLDFTLAAAQQHAATATRTLVDTVRDPRDWIIDGGWWKFPAAAYGWLRFNQGSFSFDFLKQSSHVLFVSKTRHVEWVIDYHDEGNRIVYAMDDHQLRRRVVSAGKAEPEVKVSHGVDSPIIWKLEITISPDHVVISERGGKVLDDYRRPKPEAPLGKFGFRGPVALAIPNVH